MTTPNTAKQRRRRETKIAVEKEVAPHANNGDDDTCKNPGATHGQIVRNSSRFPPTDNRPYAGDRNIAAEKGEIPKTADARDDPAWTLLLGGFLKHPVHVLTTRDRMIPPLHPITVRLKGPTLVGGKD